MLVHTAWQLIGGMGLIPQVIDAVAVVDRIVRIRIAISFFIDLISP